MMSIAKFQIGKNGITPGVIDSLLLAFKTHKVIRISVLQASGRDRVKTKNMAEALLHELKGKSRNSHSYTVIGFTIVMRRHAGR